MEQSQAMEILLSGKNCFVTWPAGSGKTYLTEKFIEELREQDKTVIVTAPTGIAAINIGWATIHSTFKMFGNYLHFRIPKPSNIDWNLVTALIIDEISMVWPDYVDYIDLSLKRFLHNDLPFGGIQVVFIGDPKQLPPVYGSFTDQDKKDLEWLREKYGSLTFDKAKAYEWFEVLELDRIHRQKDPKFIDILNTVRDGNFNVLKQLNQSKGTSKSVHLKPYNNMVDSHNQIQFDKLKWDSKKYYAEVSGKFNVKNCITPEELDLKVWARIMVTKNLQCWLVNWDLWSVKEMLEDSVIIYSDRFERDEVITFEEWKEIEYDGTTEKLLWTFYQIPLKLSWAMTIHKCLEENQLVKTNDGLIPIKDVQIWQIVDTWFSFQSIIGKEFTWEKEVLKIVTRSGWEIITSKEHRLLSVIDSRHEYIESQDFKWWDFLVMNRTLNFDGNDIEIHKPKVGIRSKDIKLPNYIDCDMAYFIGLLIWERYDIYGLLVGKINNKAKTIIFTSKMFREFLLSIGIWYVTWPYKSIPECFLKSKIELKKNILMGLFDTDWSISKNGLIRYVSTSKKLIDQIKLLLLDFGIVSYINEMQLVSDNHNQAYCLNISWENVILFKRYLWFNIGYKQSLLQSFVTKGKSSVDFVINKNEIIKEFKDKVGWRWIKWKWYRNDSKIKWIFSCKNLSYHQISYLDKFAKDRWIELQILNETLNNNFYYDEIVSIENIWVRKTYDIEVEWDHSFICQGFVSHNSQGLSLDDVCLSYVKGMSKELVYVGLSRCTTFENLYISM